MAERDAQVRAIPVTEGTKPVDEGVESMPLERDGAEATGGVRGGRELGSDRGQPSDALDQGVATEHVRSPSQGARPEGDEDATLPGAEGATSVDAPPADPVDD